MAERLPFAAMLMGGHPNSLGRTLEVVDLVLAEPAQFEQLYQCYLDKDEVVRLRTSNAMKRLWRAKPELVTPYLDRFLTEIAQIDQASTRWTLAQLFGELDRHLSAEQRSRAVAVLKRNLAESDDWIVVNQTLETLGGWAKADADLRDWLKPHLMRYSDDRRTSVSGKAHKLLKTLASR
jgi:transcription elongation factor GreA-like protein